MAPSESVGHSDPRFVSEYARRVLPELGELSGQLHAGQQANALTLKLLNFNKQQPRQTTVQDLRGILKNSSSLLNQVTTPDINLVTRYPKDPLYADVVEDQIENILLNLIINARDALLEGGEIKLVVAPAFLTPEFCKVEPGLSPADSAKFPFRIMAPAYLLGYFHIYLNLFSVPRRRIRVLDWDWPTFASWLKPIRVSSA